MKLKLVLLALVFTAGVAGALPDFAMTVPTNSVKIAPARNLRIAPRWVSGAAVVQGQVLMVERQFFMAEEAIASSTTTPSQDSRFRNIGLAHSRASLALCNTGGTDIWVNIGADARIGYGIKLPPEWVITLNSIQTAVYAVSEGGSGALSGVDAGE